MNTLLTKDQTFNQLIENSGKQQFASQLLQSMQQLAQCDHCTLVIYDPKEFQAKTLVCEGKIESQLAANCAKIYDQYLYREDPNFNSITGIDRAGDHFVQNRIRSDITSREYRNRLFDRCGVQEKATVFYRTSELVLSLNLYRLSTSLYSDPLQLDWTTQTATLLATIFQKHADLCESNTGEQLSQEWLMKQLNARFGNLLTAREQSICLLIVLGYTSDSIALNLNISVNTVLTHRRNAYEKLHIGTQNQLFALLVDGMLKPVN